MLIGFGPCVSDSIRESVSKANSTVQFAFDTLSRMKSETQGPNPIGTSGKTISYTFDNAGNRGSATYFSGYGLNYTADAVGRWTKIENQSQEELVAWTYFGPQRRIGP